MRKVFGDDEEAKKLWLPYVKDPFSVFAEIEGVAAAPAAADAGAAGEEAAAEEEAPPPAV